LMPCILPSRRCSFRSFWCFSGTGMCCGWFSWTGGSSVC
jgi:hypothetical protein